MNLKKLRKPFKSIYDIYDVMKFFNRFNGVACFSSAKRIDGRVVHFYDKGDEIIPLVVSIISLTGYSMLFLQRCYMMDTQLDNLMYKFGVSFFCFGAITSRLIMVRRIEKFLHSHKLIEEVDVLLKQRKINVNYEESRNIAKTMVLSSFCCYLAMYLTYSDRFVSEDLKLYNFICVTYALSISLGTVLLAGVYLAVIAALIRERFQFLCINIANLKKTKNHKMVEQELLMISVVHLKLCQAWSYAVDVLGPAIIMVHALFYTCCFFPLTYFDYILPRVKYEMAPMLFVMGLIMYRLLRILSGLKGKADELKETLIRFHLYNKLSEPTVSKMMEHVDISLVFNGFFVVDEETLLSGVKTCSTYMMFFLQMNAEISGRNG